MRHEKVMGHIQITAQCRGHRLQMVGLFADYLIAVRLCLRRVWIETLTASERLSMQQSFLGKFNQIHETAIFICRRILNSVTGRSVGTRCRLLRLGRRIRERAETCQRQTDARQEYNDTN